ncbi:lytic polysaccharide monooxygenase auxiliary activity family 9 protein [Micromonospora endophytica]|uniref:Chitin-binding protein n=1 Tax=Micromonospora endophytica TaxID=515350 RepID=A0A2W2C4D5_9ACTN|nr:lytic polysaccharide monooxygenase [Micromonospora endophytica]PZF93412.1 chitin-binding protein [Micromonospora endophytica]RIW50845.1 chitin-binding protein [Micromonospora endophytica]BCJ58378.1 hypothetical protein Jiend_18000 [Micromonospora endophytica]
MTVRRIAAMLAAVAAATIGASPAYAQGAPSFPVGRALACAPNGEHAETAACLAAIRTGAAVREWDNIRVYGVDGRDREQIPDGELCSGGLSAYQGLDLARTDWPTTRLTAGAQLTFRYRSTVPHQGVFRFYLTRADYLGTGKLTWADLDTMPFLRVADPQLRDGEYQMSVRLPADRTGRHIIYTIWQTSDSADTYYSCSDVEIQPPGSRAQPSSVPVADVTTPPAADAAAEPTAPGGDAAAGDEGLIGDAATDASRNELPAGALARPVASVSSLDGLSWPLYAGGALGVLLLVLVGKWLRGSRGSRSGPPPGRPCTVRNHRANPRIW